MKTSFDVVHQTRKFNAQPKMLLSNFRYCTNGIKCLLFKSCCANMCFGFTPLAKTLKCSKLVTTVFYATCY